MSCEFSRFLQKLLDFLSCNSSYSENAINIFRAHNNKLDLNGDLSFSLNSKAWEKHLTIKSSELENKITEYLLKYKTQKYDEIYFDLIANSDKFPFQISKCVIEKEKLLIFLNRTEAFKKIIALVNSSKTKYISFTVPDTTNIIFETEIVNSNVSKMDLTDLRIQLLKDVLPNFLKIGVATENLEGTEKILLTNKSLNPIVEKKIVCGVVISNKLGKKNTSITAEEYYNKRVIDMRLIAQHKYGVRVNSEPGWADFFNKLGQSAVSIDLLHVKCNRTIVIDIENASSNHSRGASFILYNCARMAKLFKQFDQKVQQGLYPSLPDVEDINFVLLNQPEEWELLYVYLLQYPTTVKSCIKDILNSKINVHNLCTFLDSLCSIFSIYYRRVRILTEPRKHLFPVLHARIYLLKAVEIILHHALSLLNISPVTQM